LKKPVTEPKRSQKSKDPASSAIQPNGYSIFLTALVLERQRPDQGVSGDPCIVWDEAIRGWRMVLFCDPWGHAQAICTNRDDLGPGQWKLEGPLPVTNPESLSENSEWCCFRGKGWMARRDEVDCFARQRMARFGESNSQGLGSPYPPCLSGSVVERVLAESVFIRVHPW
jgi:hypothetical protein